MDGVDVPVKAGGGGATSTVTVAKAGIGGTTVTVVSRRDFSSSEDSQSDPWTT